MFLQFSPCFAGFQLRLTLLLSYFNLELPIAVFSLTWLLSLSVTSEGLLIPVTTLSLYQGTF